MEEDKKDSFGPDVIFGSLFALISDGSFLFALALAIPGIGFVIAAFIVMGHYLAGLLVLAFFWKRIHGWLAVAVMVVAIILPLPTLTIGIVLGFILSSPVIAEVVEQVGIQVVAAATGGAGEVLEAGAVAGEAAEGVGVVAEVGGATLDAGGVAEGTVPETATGVPGEGAGAAGGAPSEASGAEGGGTEASPEDISETKAEKNPMEVQQKELFEEPEPTEREEPPSDEEPENKEDKKTQQQKDIERLQKAFEQARKIGDRFQQPQQSDKEEEDEQEDYQQAA